MSMNVAAMSSETKERWIRARVTHGSYVGGKESPEHAIWRGMIQRCKEQRKNYENVKVCKRWMKFENFISDMRPKPSVLSSAGRRGMHGPEFHEKKEIDAFLKKLGTERCWWFNPYMAGFGKSGVGDKIACICGTFWDIEVKRPGKEPTAIQTRRMNEVRQAGGHAVAGTAEVVIAELRAWLAVRGIVV